MTMIDVISRALNPYTQNDEFMKLAEQPEMRFVISNTTEAGIAFDPTCKLEDAPASSYPGKLTQLLCPLRTDLPEWPQAERNDLSVYRPVESWQ